MKDRNVGIHDNLYVIQNNYKYLEIRYCINIWGPYTLKSL